MLRALLARVIDFSTYAGLLVLITGGVRTRKHPALPDLNLMLYGPLFLPLAICLVLGYRPARSRVIGWCDRASKWFDALAPERRRSYVVATVALAMSASSTRREASEVW